MSRNDSNPGRPARVAPGNADGVVAAQTGSRGSSERKAASHAKVTSVPAAAFSELVGRARDLVGNGEHRVLLGVTGSPGAGKTTLVQALAAALRSDPPPGLKSDEWVAHVPMDGFHLADVELHRLGRHTRKGAHDTFDAYGYLALLRRLRADEPSIVYAPAFEHDLGQPLAGAIPIPAAARLVLTEGNYLLLDPDPWPAIARELNEVWFCALNDKLRRTRLLARHLVTGKQPDSAANWVRDVDEPNAHLIARSQSRADIIVASTVLNNVHSPTK